MLGRHLSTIGLIPALFCIPANAAGPTFIPDQTFKGSSLNGWRTVGQADWKAQNGELIGTAKAAGTGGWLMLDRSYQDIGIFANYHCAAGCKTGVLLRAEKSGDGIKGVYVSLSDEDLGAYRVTLNAMGQETQREKLRFAGGQIRIAPPPDPAAPARPPGPPGAARGPAAAGFMTGPNLTISRPAPGIHPDWNSVEILLDANIVRTFLNNGGQASSAATDDDALGFGSIALYAGGSGEVHFKDIAYRDLSVKSLPAEQSSSRFRVQKLNEFYYAWSAAAADFNKDGVMDVVAGPYIYNGPDYTTSREIYLAQGVNTSTQYSNDCWVTHAADFTGDGWPDVLTTSHSGRVGAVLYINPKGESRRWEKVQVVPIVQTEATLLRDVDGDGKPELVYGAEGYVRLARPDPANPKGPWIVQTISERGPWGAGHGIGVGDINGDGRKDVVTPWGWWEQPAAGNKQELWTHHPEAFGKWTRSSAGGAEIAVFDANGDGLPDIVTSLQAHGWGLSWFEQKRTGGKISFVEHTIMGDRSTDNAGGVTFSQLHGSAHADVDGDGVEDFIVGKRFWSHLDNFYDPDPYGPPVLYWYRTVRDAKAPGGARFVPELIHNRSGVGSDILAVDLNKDGVIDLVSATRSGTFIFWGKRNGANVADRRK